MYQKLFIFTSNTVYFHTAASWSIHSFMNNPACCFIRPFTRWPNTWRDRCARVLIQTGLNFINGDLRFVPFTGRGRTSHGCSPWSLHMYVGTFTNTVFPCPTKCFVTNKRKLRFLNCLMDIEKWRGSWIKQKLYSWSSRRNNNYL